MYPYIRLAKELFKFRNASPLDVLETHVSHHICWPVDIDPWIELNNGRTLTLYDLGRIPHGARAGVGKTLKANGWGITVAGNSLRYRRRVRAFHRFEMRTRCVGWDARFIYTEQSMWRKGECLNHMLLRSAVVGPNGIVAPASVVDALDPTLVSPPIPDWVARWIDADAHRPWPPQRE
jgi:acyl-CoA thioesterase FadM